MRCKINLHKKVETGVKGQTLSYQAKENIDAGEFVELITKYKAGSDEVSEDKLISDKQVKYFTVTKLSNDKVFIVYKESTYILHGCIIDKNTMTIELDKIIYTTSADIRVMSIVALTESKLCIAFNEGAYSNASIIFVRENDIAMRSKNYFRK